MGNTRNASARALSEGAANPLQRGFLCALLSLVLAAGLVPAAPAAAQAATTERVVQVASSGLSFAALTESGIVYTWGSNALGSCGAGEGVDWVNEPVEVLRDVKQISAGGAGSVAAVTNDGSLYVWGSNLNGQLGTGDDHAVWAPTRVMDNVGYVSMGVRGIAITNDGWLYVSGEGDTHSGVGTSLAFQRIADYDFVSAVFCDDGVIALRADGTMWSRGNNDHGLLLGSSGVHGDFEQVLPGVKVSKVTSNGPTVGIVAASGQAYTWGYNDRGQIGNGTSYNANNSPEWVTEPVGLGLGNVVDLSIGGQGSVAAVTSGGQLWTWGVGDSGQLGIGSTADKLSPTASQKGVAAAVMGSGSLAFVKKNGSLWVSGVTQRKDMQWQVTSPVQLLTDIYDTVIINGSNANASASEFKIGSQVKFDIPENVPLIGGGSVDLGLGFVPVQFEREGNTYRIGIGTDDVGEVVESGGWTSFKKFVETQKTDLVTGMRGLDVSRSYNTVVTQGFKASPKLSVWGYAEGTISGSGHVSSVKGKISFGMKAKGTQEWQAVVVVVPVTFSFTLEAGLSATASLGFDFNRSEVYFGGNVDVTLPKVKLTGGVGVAWVADVSVYGSASNVVSIKGATNSANGRLEAKLSGELGVRARALFFEYEKALLEGEWKYLSTGLAPRMRSAAGAGGDAGGWFGINRVASSAWQGAGVEAGGASPLALLAEPLGAAVAVGETRTLQESVYNGTDPVVVKTASGTKVMVLVSDVAARSEGNHTAVCYSVYDEAAGAWREPVIVQDDGTADFGPSVAVDGEDVWVAWSNASREFSPAEVGAQEFPETLAAACDIACARIDVETGAVEAVRVTGNAFYDAEASMAVVGGVPWVAWLSNEGNDPFELDGRNAVNLARVDGAASGALPAAETVHATDVPVTAVAAGALGGEASVAFVLDGGAEGAAGGTLMARQGAGECTEVAKGAANPTFAQVRGQDSLVWHVQGEEGGSLWAARAADGEPFELVAEHAALSADYSLTDAGAAGQLVLCCADAEAAGAADAADAADEGGAAGTAGAADSANAGSRVVAFLVGQDAVAGPTLLTDAQGYASCASGVAEADGSGWTVAMLRSDVTIDAEGGRVLQEADLCVVDVAPAAQLCIADLRPVDEEMLSRGFLATVENRGLAASGSVGVDLFVEGDDSHVGWLDEDLDGLEPGESATVTVPFAYSGAQYLGKEFTVAASCGNGTPGSASVVAGAINVTLSQAELQEDPFGARSLFVVAQNESGAYQSDLTFQVRAGGPDGEVLAERTEAGVQPHGFSYIRFEGDAWAAIEQVGAEALYVSVSTPLPEAYGDDNFALVYAGDEVLGDLDHLRAELPTLEFDVNGGFSLAEDLKVVAVYADGTEKVLAPGEYATNLSELDMTTPGEKGLVATYEEVGQARSVKVPLVLVGEPAQQTVVLSFDTQGGSAVSAQRVVAGTAPARPAADPVREGHVFAGWFADAECTRPFDFSAPLTQDAVAYAGWKEDGTSGPGDEGDEVDKTRLAAAIAEAVATEQGKKTDGAYADLQAAIDAARAAHDAPDATQDSIDAACDTLEAAMAAFAASADASGGEGGAGGGDGDDGDGGEGGAGEGAGNGGGGSGGEGDAAGGGRQDGAGIPATGDAAGAALAVAAAVAIGALCPLLLAARRRRGL